MANDDQPPTTLNAFDIGCLAVGGIIGVGIFFTPSKVAQRCDDAGQVVLAWCLGGVLALLGGLVFAELSCRVRGHGGTFVYLHKAFGPLPAFLYGWTNWLVIQSGALGVIGMILVDNLDALVHPGTRTAPDTKVAIAVFAILAFTGLNLLGLRLGKRVQNALTVTKTLAVFAIVVLAVFARGEEPTRAFGVERKGTLTALAGAMLPVMFAFGGWQQASFVAGAARRPRFDVPVGILGGVAVVVLAYVTVNLAFLELLGFGGVAQSKEVGVEAARAALAGHGLGDHAGRLLAAAIVVSSCGILNTICLAPPYVLHTMAKAGLFPEIAGRLHASTQAPTVAVLVQGSWGAILLVGAHLWVTARGDRATSDVLGFLLDGVVFADWMFFSLVGLALLRLRKEPHPGGFRIPAGGIVAVVFTAAGLGIAYGACLVNWEATKVGLAICATGLPAFALMRRAARRRAD
jgi:APA family basic amino acid/polyamine antiporter